MDRGAWQATVHRVTKSWTWLKLLSTDAHIYHWISTLAWKKSYDKSRQHIKKQRHHFANKGPYSQSYGFSSSHLQMWELDHKEVSCWRIDAFKLWCWGRVLRVPWIARRSSQLILKEINLWILIGRTDAIAKAPILWQLDAKSWLIGKDDAGKDWGQEKGVTEDWMGGWHHWLNAHEIEQTPGDSGGQGDQVCCSPQDHKELDTTERLNNKSENWAHDRKKKTLTHIKPLPHA